MKTMLEESTEWPTEEPLLTTDQWLRLEIYKAAPPEFLHPNVLDQLLNWIKEGKDV